VQTVSALMMPNEILSMTAQAARRVVELGDGDCALLYLALLERGGDTAAAQRKLKWSRERLIQAYGRLAAQGLVDGGGLEAAVPAPENDRPPEYSRGDVLNALEREPEFTGLYREMERLLGRTLSDADLKSLYTIYDFLHLPVEVILLLTGYVTRTLRRQKGRSEGVYPRMPQIRKEAFVWKRLGIDSAEKAEEYFRRQQAVDSREWAILSMVGATERRSAVEDERKYINRWVEMGVSDELIRLAYERTVFRKGDMNWAYMNRILQSWHQAGHTTAEQVKAGERGRAKVAGTGKKEDYQPSQKRIQESSDWLDEFLKNQEGS